MTDIRTIPAFRKTIGKILIEETNAVLRPCSEDDDLFSAIVHNEIDFDVTDITHIHACVPGEAEGPDWYWAVELHKTATGHRFALLWGGCDYTGWD